MANKLKKTHRQYRLKNPFDFRPILKPEYDGKRNKYCQWVRDGSFIINDPAVNPSSRASSGNPCIDGGLPGALHYISLCSIDDLKLMKGR